MEFIVLQNKESHRSRQVKNTWWVYQRDGGSFSVSLMLSDDVLSLCKPVSARDFWECLPYEMCCIALFFPSFTWNANAIPPVAAAIM